MAAATRIRNFQLRDIAMVLSAVVALLVVARAIGDIFVGRKILDDQATALETIAKDQQFLEERIRHLESTVTERGPRLDNLEREIRILRRLQ